MSFRKLLLAGATLVASAAAVTPANASIIDRPHFKVLGVVIVWAADSNGTAAMATDFIIDDDAGVADTDLILEDGRTLVTGELTATPDAASSAGLGSVLQLERNGSEFQSVNTNSAANFSAFDVTDATLTSDNLTYESSFYVASNTPFAIDAEIAANSLEESGDLTAENVGYLFDVSVSGTDGTGPNSLTYGGNAQNPGTATGTATDLKDLETKTQVFNGTQRTAAQAGTIVSQSVRFDATYTLGAGTAYDLSQGAGEVKADVVYTVYVP